MPSLYLTEEEAEILHHALRSLYNTGHASVSYGTFYYPEESGGPSERDVIKLMLKKVEKIVE